MNGSNASVLARKTSPSYSIKDYFSKNKPNAENAADEVAVASSSTSSTSSIANKTKSTSSSSAAAMGNKDADGFCRPPALKRKQNNNSSNCRIQASSFIKRKHFTLMTRSQTMPDPPSTSSSSSSIDDEDDDATSGTAASITSPTHRPGATRRQSLPHSGLHDQVMRKRTRVSVNPERSFHRCQPERSFSETAVSSMPHHAYEAMPRTPPSHRRCPSPANSTSSTENSEVMVKDSDTFMSPMSRRIIAAAGMRRFGESMPMDMLKSNIDNNGSKPHRHKGQMAGSRPKAHARTKRRSCPGNDCVVEVKPAPTNPCRPANRTIATIVIDDSSDEEHVRGGHQHRHQHQQHIDTKPIDLELIEVRPMDMDAVPAEGAQRRIKSVVRKSKQTIIHDITAVARKSMSPAFLFNVALAGVLKDLEHSDAAAIPATNPALERLRKPRPKDESPGQRLPREVVALIIAFMHPSKAECLALRRVSCVFHDALTMWQADDAKHLFEQRYGPDTPPGHLTWATDGQVLAQHVHCKRIDTRLEVEPQDRIGASVFHRWMVLTSPRSRPFICLRCGRFDHTLTVRDGANLGRFCTQCWDSADYWLRWRICHWVRGLEDLGEFRTSWFLALNDYEWLTTVPCFYDIDDEGRIKYAVAFDHFCELMEQWTDCPPRTLLLHPDGRWETVMMTPAEWERLPVEKHEVAPLPPGFMPHLTENIEGSSIHQPIIL
ncbi:hypothetical protein SYNPS1DRAFT_22321 [Syncephalis pseudoplumigaleata]|uniref:F-box domain-containing protein n=1 Tax=Syncephalis pseudoplumigaleata TaxID=1712513 RepID=A0A4P9Z0J6_9FUNG|nr:hypothetical protein SYNPS1DRAFT_22321 [Syncephalis pseudoplumigaleata]|eukprot:RKP25785.1 hypothetical protein SYNPS1DRAFT_22321 [Syncephalis pseudoplumigaleata]